MIYDIAVSYAKEEAARLEAVVARLEGEGLSAWTDRGLLRVGEGEQAERLVPAGVEHWQAIRDGIDHSAVFVFLDSPRWRASGYCRKELGYAQERGARVVAVGEEEDGEVAAAAWVDDGDVAALLAAVRAGLDISRTHARIRAAGGEGAEEAAVSTGDVTALAEANLGELGMSVPSPMAAQMDEALSRHRRRRRRLATLLAATIAVAALLAIVGLIAWVAAQRDGERTAAAARHVESLALASASTGSANTFAQLDLARRAIDLEQNSTTVSALREAVEAFGEGVSLRLDRDEPLALAVADNGDVATVQSSGAVTLISARGGEVQREVPAEAGGAAPVIAFAPAGRKLAVIRGDGGEAEIVDFATGRLARVRGTDDTVAVFFVADHRGIAVSRSGEVLEFDPEEPHPRATKVQTVVGPVRAATLANGGPEGEFALATLVDGAVEVTEIGGPAAPWRASLPEQQVPFKLGWEAIRVCGGQLSILASVTASGLATGFGIPYTVDARGKVVHTGSLYHSFGSICLPEGNSLAVDFLHGQYSFPAHGPLLPSLTGNPAERVTYAVASSENDQWAAAAGSDGTLKLVALDSYGRTRPLREVEAIAPAGRGVVLTAADGEVRSVPFTPAPTRPVAAAAGEAARGAYLDPSLGTVLAVGEEVLLVRDGRVRRRVALGARVSAIHPGRTGASAVVMPTRTKYVFDVPLDGGRRTAIELPDDIHAGATQVSDVAELLGRQPHLAVAATDGYVSLLAYPSGHELRRRRIAPAGPIALAVDADGRLVSSASDGVVRILDPRTLAVEVARRVMPAGPTLVATSPSGRFAALFSGSGEAVVVTLPGLEPLIHIDPISALNSVAFEGDRRLLLGADLHWIGGGGEASVTSWPLCRPCTGDPARLREMAAALAEPRPSGERPSFVPSHEGEDPPGAEDDTAEAAGLATVDGSGVEGLRLGMTAADLLARHLIGPMHPGCEFDSGQRIADLRPPLAGSAVFHGRQARLWTVVLIGQPPPCSPEIERPSAARPSKIPGERIEPTPAGRAPRLLAA